MAVAILCHLRSSEGWRHNSVLKAVSKAIVESGVENLNPKQIESELKAMVESRVENESKARA